MSAPAPRSRYGATRPTRQQRLKRLALLGAAVGTTAEDAAALAQQVAARAFQSDDELVAAFATLAAGRPDAQGLLLVVLVDLDGRPLEDAAALLGLPVLDARSRLDLARTGDRPLPAPCRGWGLASGRSGLTAGELQAGVDHLGLCPRCRDRRSALDAARRQLATRAAGAAGLLGAAQLAAGGAAVTTVGGIVAGKAVLGAVAGLGAAVLATGAAVAAVPPAGFSPTPRPAVSPAVVPVVAPVADASPLPGAPRPTTTASPCALPCVAPSAVPSLVPLPLPTTLPGLDELPGELPDVGGDLTSDVPALPLPTLLPSPLLPLPTGLPVLPDDLPLLP